MKRTENGFTLVELMAVIAIIGILTALIAGLAAVATGKSARQEAEADVKKLELFVTDYKSQHGKVPGNAGDSEPACRAALSNALANAKHSLTNMTDPWDEPYHYQATSKHTFYLWSTAGSNAESNRPAWIGNPDPDWNP